MQRVWKHAHRRSDEFKRARNGDHLLVPFECDSCIFWKLKGCCPRECYQDNVLLCCIRQANLDAFWSRASSTVDRNRQLVKRQLKISSSLGLPGPYIQHCPLPEEDYCGYRIAVSMLLMSSETTGKHSQTHLQFDTVRRLRTTYGNFLRSSNQACHVNSSLVDDNGHYSRFSHDECGTLWFHRFAEGMGNRMGKVHLPNVAFSTPLLIKFLEEIEKRISEAADDISQHDWIIMSVYCVSSYVLSLRGDEGFLIDLNETRLNWDNHSKDYVIIALLGQLKGTKEESTYTFPSVNITTSGINVKEILKRAVIIKKKLGFVDGPLISDTQGFLWSSRTVDDMMHEILLDLFTSDRDLFPLSIKSNEELIKSYHCYRTFRRSSDTRATEKQVASLDIDVVNRWRSEAIKRAGGRATMAMRGHYCDLDKLLLPFLRYTEKM